MSPTVPPIRRGQMWTLASPRSARHTVVVIQADAAMDHYPHTAVVAVCDTTGTAPDTLLSTPVTKPTDAMVIGTQIHTFTAAQISEGAYLGIVQPEQMEAVSRTIRLSLELVD